MVAEAYAYHRNNLVNRWSDYGVHTRPTLARGAFYTAGDVAQAERFRRQFSREVAKLFESHDVIITPTAAVPAERAAELSPSKRLSVVSYTGHWNLTGLPAVAVPVGFSTSGLPLSMQIVGKPFAEATVLKVADALQRISDWHLAIPPVEALLAA
jgi:aspartyl-tRNA(Asn)/glutamyl-tRNA(Gln) amidotransferase subunit A